MRPSRMPRIRLGCLGDEGSFRFRKTCRPSLEPKKSQSDLEVRNRHKESSVPVSFGCIEYIRSHVAI